MKLDDEDIEVLRDMMDEDCVAYVVCVETKDGLVKTRAGGNITNRVGLATILLEDMKRPLNEYEDDNTDMEYD